MGSTIALQDEVEETALRVSAVGAFYKVLSSYSTGDLDPAFLELAFQAGFRRH